jgi:hypothetical protein
LKSIDNLGLSSLILQNPNTELSVEAGPIPGCEDERENRVDHWHGVARLRLLGLIVAIIGEAFK